MSPRKSNGIETGVHQQQVLARMRGKRNPLTLLVGMQTSTTTLEKNLEAT
jgi:hypothetical protein